MIKCLVGVCNITSLHSKPLNVSFFYSKLFQVLQFILDKFFFCADLCQTAENDAPLIEITQNWLKNVFMCQGTVWCYQQEPLLIVSTR